MKINKTSYLLLLPLFGIVALLFYNSGYTEFEPALFVDNAYKHRINVTSTQMFFNNLKIVLDYDNVPYKIDDQGKVLVKRKLSRDEELLFNYTKKALDTLWINSHTKVR